MAEKDWTAILKEEDRIIANSDRRFRYHCYSLESMSEELTYQERSIYIQDDFTEQLMVENFIDTVVFCQVLFPEKSVGIPFFQQGIFPAFSGHYASLRMRACSIR